MNTCFLVTVGHEQIKYPSRKYNPPPPNYISFSSSKMIFLSSLFLASPSLPLFLLSLSLSVSPLYLCSPLSLRLSSISLFFLPSYLPYSHNDFHRCQFALEITLTITPSCSKNISEAAASESQQKLKECAHIHFNLSNTTPH